MPFQPERGGHAPGHLREAFVEWLDDPEQTEVVVGGNEEQRPLSWLIGQLWNCTDILPSDVREQVNNLLTGEPDGFRNTYAAAVRRLKGEFIA